MYCGIGRVPKGKERGTAKQCVKLNQVRYYGLHEIDPELLENKKKKKVNIVDEQLKLRTLQEKSKRLVRNYKELSKIFEDEESTAKQIKNANKKKEKMIKEKDILLKKLKEQKKIISDLEKEGKHNKKKTTKKKANKVHPIDAMLNKLRDRYGAEEVNRFLRDVGEKPTKRIRRK